eukprot:scaffold17193_cov89-Skeletonema_marinoi.AAC.1
MKFPIALLSLLTSAAYAQHEPKGLRGSAEDLEFLEHNVVAISSGSSATITGCGSGEQCCVPMNSSVSCGSIIYGGSGTTSYRGGSNCAISLSNDDYIGGGSNCVLSCSGSCDPVVSAGGGSGGGGGGFGGGGGGSGGDGDGGGWGGFGGGGSGGDGGGSGECDNWSREVLNDAMSKSKGCARLGLLLGESTCAACGCKWVDSANMCTGTGSYEDHAGGSGGGDGGGWGGFGGGGSGGGGGGSGECDNWSREVLNDAMSEQISKGCARLGLLLGESTCAACGCKWVDSANMCTGSYEEDEELTSEDYDLDSYDMASKK